MFQIVGEGMFIGDSYVAGGMKIADHLREMGFSVIPRTMEFMDSETRGPKRYGFVFECGSDTSQLLV